MYFPALLSTVLAVCSIATALPQPDINIHISTQTALQIPAENKIIEINSLGDFLKLIEKNEKVAIFATAIWCDPCHFIGPYFEKYPNIVFAKFDTDQQPEITVELGVKGLPVFYFFKEGTKVDELTGANPTGLERKLQDLDALRTQAESKVVEIKSLTEYYNLVIKNEKVAIFAWVTRSGPSRYMAPVYEQQSGRSEFQTIVFAKVDVDDQSDVATVLDPMTLPTFYFYQDGEEVDELRGASPTALDAKLQNLVAA